MAGLSGGRSLLYSVCDKSELRGCKLGRMIEKSTSLRSPVTQPSPTKKLLSPNQNITEAKVHTHIRLHV